MTSPEDLTKTEMRKLTKLWLGLILATCLAPAGYAACTYSLSPSARNHGHGSATNSITVNAGLDCQWDVTNTNGWITVLSATSGTSTGAVTYAVSANTIPTARTGVVAIAGQLFTVVQDPAPCNFTLVPTQRLHGNGATANSIQVLGNSNCAWSVTVTSAWITLTGTTNGLGDGVFPYAIAANNAPVARTSYIAVASSIFTMRQTAASCLYELSPTNRLHGYAGSTGRVDLATVTPGCAWQVVNTNDWIAITANASGTNVGSFGYTVAPNPHSTPRNGNITVWGEVFTVYQHASPCSFSLTPSTVTTSAEAETNVVNITGITGCSWGVTNTNSWISFQGPTSGVGSGTLTWVIQANAGEIGRTGVVSVAGQDFTIRQGAALCSYKLSPTNRVHGYGSASNSVSLTVLSTCPWSVSNTNTWITIHTPLSGTGSTTVGYSLTQNPDVNARSGTLQIAGQLFTITQNGVGCAVNLTPTTRNHGHGAATNTVVIGISASCDWTVVNTNSWITIAGPTNGVGGATVVYEVAPNPAAFPRSGYLSINEGTMFISQNAAPCNFSVVPNDLTHTAGIETGSVSVASAIGCAWTGANTNSWITLLSGTNGSGNGNVFYTVATNLNPLARVGNLVVAGQMVEVTQNGVACSYRLSPTNRTHGAGSNMNTLTVTVSNPCPWQVVNTNSWITIVSGASGAGPGIITYSIAANTGPLSRSGTITVDGAATVISQNGVACTLSLTPSQRTHGYGAASNSFTVNTGDGCNWEVINTNNWITLMGVTNGSASATVGYTISENTNLTERIGMLAVDGQTFIVTQRAASCSISLTPAQRMHGNGANTASVSVATAPGCGWTVFNTNSWVTILSANSGSGEGTVEYSIAANGDPNPRAGVILIGDAEFAISQSGFNCNTRLSPTNRTHGFGAATGAVNVIAGPSCTWTVATTNDWITLTSITSGSGNATFNYTVSANFGNQTRVGAITMEDQVLVISQLAPTNGFQFESVALNSNGELSVRLGGGPAGIWELQSSSNLLHWTTIGLLTNTEGRVFYTIPPPLTDKKFLRTVLP